MPAAAQPAPPDTNSTYEREAENPITRFYTLPLRFKQSYDDGFYGGATNTVEINNAVLPIALDDDWFLIARSKAGFVSQAPKAAGNSWQDGLNNAQTSLFVSPARAYGFFWGAGPVIAFPTATNSAIGTNQWGAGPTVALGWQRAQHWTLALVANNVWSVDGSPNGGPRSSNLLLNPIISYRFGDGWSLSTSPNITANWTARSNERWTVPLGAGIGKAFTLGTQPMTLKFETHYNAIRSNDRSSIWAAQLTLTFLFAR